ncbi:MAG: fibronectin type III domain-containing protein [Bacteroidales bacterium]|nr:fibronectin type III domain-containing protein [Bacteroidales bacterium]
MKIHRFGALMLLLLLPLLGTAQSAASYTFTTGVNAAKWRTPSSSATTMSFTASYPGTSRTVEDEGRTAVTPIGFTFPFCGANYTQFSFSTNGRLRLGPQQVSSNWRSPFDNTYSLTTDTNDLPFVCAWATDGFIDSRAGHYVKYEVVGTAPHRVLCITVRCNSSMYADAFGCMDDEINYQIQLGEDGTICYVYGTADVDEMIDDWLGYLWEYQVGFASTPTDVVAINTGTHSKVAYNTTAADNDAYPGENRYYEFTMPAVNCHATTAVQIAGISTTSASAHWHPVSGSTRYSCTLVNTDNNTSRYSIIVGDTTAPFTALTPATHYRVEVRTLCGTADSSAATVALFTTPCAAVPHSALPYHESFDNYQTGASASISSCWLKYNYYSTATSYVPYPQNNYRYGSAGNALYFCHGYASEPAYAVLPLFDDSLYNLQLSFYLLRNQAAVAMQVGVMVDPTDTATFTPVATFQPATLTWHECTTDFGSYTGNGRYIAFRTLLLSGTYNYPIYVDEVDVHVMPSCPRPTFVVADSTTSTSAHLRWGSTRQVMRYVVEYDTASFTPGTRLGTALLEPDTVTVLSGLRPNTTYHVQLRAFCGTRDTSEAVSCTFTTSCAPISRAELPFRENFDAYQTGNSGTFSPCWTRFNFYGVSYYSNMPYASSMRALSGSNSLYLYHGNQTQAAYALLPLFEDSVNQLQVAFDLNIDNANTALQVGVMTDPADTTSFTPIATCRPTTTRTWQHFEVSLAGYHGSGRYVGLRTQSSNSSSGWALYVDNVDVDLLPTCPKPTDLNVVATTAATATISWRANGTASTYEVQYDSVPFTLGHSHRAPLIVNTTSATLPALVASTVYYVKVRAVCAAGDTSRDLEGSVRTACDAIAHSQLPYIENFDSYQTGAQATIDPCWVSYFVEPNNHSYPYPAAFHHGTSGNSLYLNHGYGSTSTQGNQPSYLVMPAFEDAITSLKVSFYLDRTHAQPLSVEVGVMTSPYDTSSFTPMGLFSPSTSSTWQRFEQGFTNYNGVGRYIAFRTHYTGTASSYQIYIDDIEVSPMPTCTDELRNLEVAAEGSEATLSWTAAPALQSATYRIRLLSAGRSRTYTTTANTFHLAGLQGYTDYTAIVEALCNGTITAADSVDFTTMCVGTGVMVGNAESTTGQNDLPVATYYKYSYTQQLVLANEMNGPQDINTIAFQYQSTTPSTSKSSCKIYMGNVSRSTFNSTLKWVSMDSLQLVYTGSITATTGWNEYSLDSVFRYDGISSLVIAVLDSNNALDGSGYKYVVTNTTGSYLAYNYKNDYTGFRMDSPQNGNTQSYRANMKLLTCDSYVCTAPSVQLDSTTLTTALLSIADFESEDTVVVRYRREGDSLWTSAPNVTAARYVLSNLQPSTTYEIALGRICTDDTLYSTLQANTECQPVALRIVATLPGRATLAWTDGCSTGRYELTYSSLPSFQPSDTTAPRLVVNDTTAHITGLLSSTTYTVYVRNLPTEGAPSAWSDALTFATEECATPAGFEVLTRQATTARVQWSSATGDAQYEVIYGPQGFIGDEGTTLVTDSTAITLTGLQPDEAYDVYITRLCDSLARSAVARFSIDAYATGNIPMGESSLSWQISPNPSRGVAVLRLAATDGPVELRIIDMTGRCCHTVLLPTGTTSHALPTTLERGAYMVQLLTRSGSTVKRYIVQ